MGPKEFLLEAWYRQRGWYPVQIDNKPFRCDPGHISFWNRVNAGTWEPGTFAILSSLLHPDAVYCDIGAWIGPTVLHAAARCKKVYCLEPDRAAFMYLLQNIKHNKLENVFPCNVALAASDAIGRMASPRGKRGDSMTSLLTPDAPNGMDVLCMRWQTWFALVGEPRFDSMKMDIEGGEFGLLPTMGDFFKQNKPNLYLSLHPHLLSEDERLAAMARIVDILSVYGNCCDAAGRPLEVEALLAEPFLHRPASYLFLSA